MIPESIDPNMILFLWKQTPRYEVCLTVSLHHQAMPTKWQTRLDLNWPQTRLPDMLTHVHAIHELPRYEYIHIYIWDYIQAPAPTFLHQKFPLIGYVEIKPRNDHPVISFRTSRRKQICKFTHANWRETKGKCQKLQRNQLPSLTSEYESVVCLVLTASAHVRR